MFHFTTNPPYSNIAKAWRKSTQKIQNAKRKPQNNPLKPLIFHDFRPQSPRQSKFSAKTPPTISNPQPSARGVGLQTIAVCVGIE